MTDPREKEWNDHLDEEIDALRDHKPKSDLWPVIALRIGGTRRRVGTLLIASCMVGALLGISLGYALLGQPMQSNTSSPRFMLILHMADNTTHAMTPEQGQRVVERYRMWSNRLAKRGQLEIGEKLVDREGWILSTESQTGRDQAGGVAGFFVLRAANYEEALRLARSCPHLEYGEIELRRIEET